MAPNLNAPEPQYSISQVNAITGVPKSTIRFWEKEFKDFLTPMRTSGNQRRYDATTVEMIKRINHLVNAEGYTLEGARRKLETQMAGNGKPQQDSNQKLTDLAETMSDFLLKKLFERVRDEETRRQGSLHVKSK